MIVVAPGAIYVAGCQSSDGAFYGHSRSEMSFSMRMHQASLPGLVIHP